MEITFPRLTGYKYEMPAERLDVKFSEQSKMALSTQDVPTKTENAPIIGEAVIHTLDDLKHRREQEVPFLLAKEVLEKHFRDPDDSPKVWLFPQLLSISRRWVDHCLTLKDNTFPQLLLLVKPAKEAASKIYAAVVEATVGEKVLKPILRSFDPAGSTRFVDFTTTRPIWITNPKKCHISHVVADTTSWEQKMAQALEEMDEVFCYVKNTNLGFGIPYAYEGGERNYYPDFIVRIKDGPEPLNLILEVSGQKRPEKAAKAATARTLWVPAVNNHGGYGRWAFLEMDDPWNAQNTIRTFLKEK